MNTSTSTFNNMSSSLPNTIMNVATAPVKLASSAYGFLKSYVVRDSPTSANHTPCDSDLMIDSARFVSSESINSNSQIHTQNDLQELDDYDDDHIDDVIDDDDDDDGFELDEDAQEVDLEYHVNNVHAHRLQNVNVSMRTLEQLKDSKFILSFLHDLNTKFKLNQSMKDLIRVQSSRIRNYHMRCNRSLPTLRDQPTFEQFDSLMQLSKSLKKKESALKQLESNLNAKQLELNKLEQSLNAINNNHHASPISLEISNLESITGDESSTSTLGSNLMQSPIITSTPNHQQQESPPSARFYSSTMSEHNSLRSLTNDNYFEYMFDQQYNTDNEEDDDDQSVRSSMTGNKRARSFSTLSSPSVATPPPPPPPPGQHIKLDLIESDEIVNSPQQKIDDKIQIASQDGKCANCEKLLKLDYGWIRRPRYCHYTNKIYCMDCMNNLDKMPIPAKILSRWDFNSYRVCSSAFLFLSTIVDVPLICVSAINPQLFDKVANLKRSRMVRKRLNLQWDVISNCPVKDGLIAKLHLSERLYYVNDTEVYSLNNLLHLQGGDGAAFLKRLANIFHEFSEHITKHCSHCSKMGKCECQAVDCPNKSSPVYAFNITNVIVCPGCKLTFHKACFKNEQNVQACPHCSAK
ncbi:plekstrin [Acrasis kona]|uniref:Plekstrin n=1 Tax=Acrasis kona TaxID=1008807 RepID=A0AAW2YP35_9EUKA